jgi:mycothiol synthase
MQDRLRADRRLRGVADLTIRPYGDDDAALVAGLMNAIEVAGDAGRRFSEDEIRSMMSGARDLDRDSRLAVIADGVLAAFGLVSSPAPGGSRARAVGGVHPGWRGRGIGRDLLAWQVGRAAEVRAGQDPGRTWTVGAGAGIADESAARLFARFGLHLVRYFVEMSAPTAGVRSASLPDGFRMVEFSDGLRTALYDAHMEAFGEHWGHEPRDIDDWAASTVDSVVFRSELSRVALHGDQVAAYLLAYDGAENDLYIGQVGTRRPWRKRGLASALLAGSLTAGAADVKATASLGVDAANPTGAVGVYERLGFTVQHSPYAVYHKVLAS